MGFITNKKLFIFLIFSFAGLLQAQTNYYKFAITFNDKENNPFSIQQADAFLSERAIARRERMNISITSHDLPVTPLYVNQVLQADTSVRLFYTSKWLNAVVVGTTDSSLTHNWANLSFVKNIRCIYVGKVPNKVPFQKASQLPFTAQFDSTKYGVAENQIRMLSLDYLHTKGFFGQGKVVAVFDAGFTNVFQISAFQHLYQDERLLGTWDFVGAQENVYFGSSHGTQVLSCMAAVIDKLYIGTAPAASYYLFRTEDGSSETISEEYNWVAAAEKADSAGVDVINSSLGYTVFDNPLDNHTYQQLDGKTTIITKGANWAAGKGILVVNSAGNSGNNSWKYIGAPADADSVLSIAAVDSVRVYAPFSSQGPRVDGAIKPNVAAKGALANIIGVGGATSVSNGTSFSAPILAGAATALWSKHPNKSNMEIFKSIEQSAHLYENPNHYLGYGIPNFGMADKILSQVNLDNYYKKQQILIYPNPVQDQLFYVDYYSDTNETIRLHIHDLKGRQIHTQELNVLAKTVITIPVQLSTQLAAGVYIVSILPSKTAKKFKAKFIAK